MNIINLRFATEERDIGVTLSSSLRPGAQCAKAARKATAVVGKILRAYRDRHTFLNLYKQYVSLESLELAGQGDGRKGAKKDGWYGVRPTRCDL